MWLRIIYHIKLFLIQKIEFILCRYPYEELKKTTLPARKSLSPLLILALETQRDARDVTNRIQRKSVILLHIGGVIPIPE